MVPIDSWLIDRVFQRVSDWTTDLFDRNCFWLAWVFLYVAGLAEVAEAVIRLREDGWEKAGIDIVICVMCAWGVLYFLADLRKAESAYRNGGRMANDLRIRFSHKVIRLFYLPLGVLATLELPFRLLLIGVPKPASMAVLAYLISLPLGLYFAACTPKPRAPQKQTKIALAGVEA
jgi:hypothetical protein